MASTAAYEPPSVERAWQAFLAHLPTILLIWVVGALGLILCILSGVAVFLVVLAVAVCTCGLGRWWPYRCPPSISRTPCIKTVL